MYLHLSVSHSVHRGRGCLADTPPGQTPPDRHLPTCKHPPGQIAPPAATAADGMHPTGMLSCFNFIRFLKKQFVCSHQLLPQKILRPFLENTKLHRENVLMMSKSIAVTVLIGMYSNLQNSEITFSSVLCINTKRCASLVLTQSGLCRKYVFFSQ